ncbi:MAG TPA: hypothetical protein VI485_20860 [Vicinamibacterales bacterium]|nr:hypothetical protein [Vicinamibacterales bacterium]
MTTPSPPLTPTEMIAVASSVLERGGYQIREGFPEWITTSTRLFEDEYNIVGLAVFPTCAELLRGWADLQSSLVEVISEKVGRTEGKAWDGYLALLTPGIAPSGDLEIEDVRYDTTRLRKLVGTGEDLGSAGDIERLLRPLLPLRQSRDPIAHQSALDLLPELLAVEGIDRQTTTILVKSFTDQKPLMEALHRTRENE